MKPFTTFLLFSVVALAPALAQTTIDAKEIIAKINRKEAITLQNTTIIGDLDLTSLANRKEVRDGGLGSQENYLSTVDVSLSFKNCTFRGKVLGYRTEDQDKKLLRTNNIVYNTDFTESVTMEGCQFEDDAAFKYSHFDQRAIFTDNTFRREALFKYSKFRNAATFSGSTFRGYADFKYTQFDESSAFQSARFERYADFKYTKFDEGVDFQKANFSGNADFKYTNFPRGTKFDDARFNGSTDFKYTKLDGRKFAPNGRY
ncbi:pentapeptide repeat-containing protein [Spirosoma validum]|uniref:Pentapeptide repeat-containing protein n=1 Tax=Spirosoma validum TaxID=2771355 RepID=A0A927GBF7_9BACT|nr:pentapeptide repeat-containing protein [Spirosoma validum]MBD2751435.1 pentapeptide repeat-containing protein [Spirosoma validum]